jgi:hypothetical protein
MVTEKGGTLHERPKGPLSEDSTFGEPRAGQEDMGGTFQALPGRRQQLRGTHGARVPEKRRGKELRFRIKQRTPFQMSELSLGMVRSLHVGGGGSPGSSAHRPPL